MVELRPRVVRKVHSLRGNAGQGLSGSAAESTPTGGCLSRSASESTFSRRRVELTRCSSTAGSLPRAEMSAAPQQPQLGVSVAFLLSYLGEHGPSNERPSERNTTREIALALKKRTAEEEISGPYAEAFVGQPHYVTGSAQTGPAEVYVSHAWDANFAELVSCIEQDSACELDRLYGVDVFTTDLHGQNLDQVAAVQTAIAQASEVLLVLDGKASALCRLWTLFEATLAASAGKLKVRCCTPGGFGSSVAALESWEAHVDGINWVQAETTRKSDDKRLRTFADKAWELCGKGTDSMLAQMRKILRHEIYGSILIDAVRLGDKDAVRACLDRGADPSQKDAMGNMAEDLATIAGRADIEELIFERRLRLRGHAPIASFFDPREIASIFETEVIFPEEDDGASDRDYDDAAVSFRFDSLTYQFPPLTERSSVASTRTPGGTSRPPSGRSRRSSSRGSPRGGADATG